MHICRLSFHTTSYTSRILLHLSTLLLMSYFSLAYKLFMSVEVSFRQRIQTDYGAHMCSHELGKGYIFPEVKRPGHEADHLPPSSAEVKNVCSYTSTPPYIFMLWCLIKHRKLLYRVVLS
jgi:hypothetical protein